jgi:hypothetical protein
VEAILQHIHGKFSERRYPDLKQMLGRLIEKLFKIQSYFATKRNEEKANLEMWSTAASEDHCNNIVRAEDESTCICKRDFQSDYEVEKTIVCQNCHSRPLILVFCKDGAAEGGHQGLL